MLSLRGSPHYYDSLAIYNQTCAQLALQLQIAILLFVLWRLIQWFSTLDAESHFEASRHFLEDPSSFEKVCMQ